MKILPLKGYKALLALKGVNALVFGMMQTPLCKETDYVEYFNSFKEKTDEEKEKFLRTAVLFVELEKEEVEALISFATDKNGIPYSGVNLKNLSLDEMHEIIVAVSMEIGRIKIELVSEEEKKKLSLSQSIPEKST